MVSHSLLVLVALLSAAFASVPVTKCILPGGRCNLGGCCPGSDCVDVPGSRTGICKSNLCLASGESCTLGGKPCCVGLSCKVVNQGAFPDGELPRICFASNCGTGDCKKIPCCPGNGCGTMFGQNFCIAPPSRLPDSFDGVLA